MKITLLNIKAKNKYCSNKDVSGGYGTSTKIGDSFFARLLESKKKSGVKIPVLTFAYLASILRKQGHAVEYREDIPGTDSDIVVIYSSIIDYKNEVAAIVKIKNSTNAIVGVVGAFTSAKPDIYHDADFVVIGEPENFFMNLTKKTKLKGIIRSETILDLDKLPFPDWDGFPIQSFSYKPALAKTPFLTMQSSRGCPYSCSFYCPYTVIQGTKYRKRLSTKVVDEIEYLVNKYKIKSLQFRDPLFSLDRSRIIEIAKEIGNRKIDIEWLCETRLDLLDKELIDIMFSAGLRVINVGIESYSSAILNMSRRKPIKIAYQEEIIKYCKKKGIKVIAFYIFGLTNDTKATIIQTIRYAKKLNTYLAQFTISTPYPGTGFYEEMKDRITDDEFEHFDINHLVFRHENLTPGELNSLKEKAFISYYYRPTWILEYLIWLLRD